MPKCKICGEAVQSGEVMHVECREKWEKELMARAEVIREREETIREREEMLDRREAAQNFREGWLDLYREEILAESKKAKRNMIFGIALASFTIALTILNLMM